MRNQKEIKKIVNRIAKEYKPEKIYLFGSYAWGKPNQDSDFDLFIIKKTKEDRRLRQLKVRKIIKGELPVDILVYTPKEAERRLKIGDFFVEDIFNKGKILYETTR